MASALGAELARLCARSPAHPDVDRWGPLATVEEVEALLDRGADVDATAVVRARGRNDGARTVCRRCRTPCTTGTRQWFGYFSSAAPT